MGSCLSQESLRLKNKLIENRKDWESLVAVWYSATSSGPALILQLNTPCSRHGMNEGFYHLCPNSSYPNFPVSALSLPPPPSLSPMPSVVLNSRLSESGKPGERIWLALALMGKAHRASQRALAGPLLCCHLASPLAAGFCYRREGRRQTSSAQKVSKASLLMGIPLWATNKSDW